MSNINELDSLALFPKYRYQVAEEYGISVRTLNRWFKREHLDIPNGIISPFHLKIIYRTFDIPAKLKVVC
jgi:hypothetical protein